MSDCQFPVNPRLGACAWRIENSRRPSGFGTSLGSASASGTIRSQWVTKSYPPVGATVLAARHGFDTRCRNIETRSTLLPDRPSSRTRRGRDTRAESCRSVALQKDAKASAAFEVASFNGRALGDDVLDVMLTLAANTPIVDGLVPDRGRIRKDFPYYGAPYTAEEQAGVTPMPRPAKKSAGSDA